MIVGCLVVVCGFGVGDRVEGVVFYVWFVDFWCVGFGCVGYFWWVCSCC